MGCADLDANDLCPYLAKTPLIPLFMSSQEEEWEKDDHFVGRPFENSTNSKST
jgi:hypothetical protein